MVVTCYGWQYKVIDEQTNFPSFECNGNEGVLFLSPVMT